jgi:hypothetical protein
MAVFENLAVNVRPPVQISDSLDTYYTAPSTTPGVAIIKELTLSNDTDEPLTFTLHKVPSSGTPGDDNIIVKNQPLLSGDSFSVTEFLGSIHVGPSGTIQAIASVTDQATLHITAYELS